MFTIFLANVKHIINLRTSRGPGDARQNSIMNTTKLNEIIAAGLIAQDNFQANLVIALSANSHLANILADAAAPVLTKEEVEKKFGQEVVEFKLVLSEDFEWIIDGTTKEPRYYKTQQYADAHDWAGSNKFQTSEFPIEGYYLRHSTMIA